MFKGWLILFVCWGLSAPAKAASDPPLSDYVGRYEAEPGRTLEIVAGAGLFAVIDEAKYTLRWVASDVFVDRSGTRVPFTRDAAGVVDGIVAEGRRHRRLSREVSAASAELLWPWPQSRHGPVSYRYQPPSSLPDGINTGDAAASALGRPAAEQVVQGVLDGTWPEVHSVLVHHQGRLVLEEYFYGYGRQRPHQMRSATKSVVSALAGIASTRSTAAQPATPVLSKLPYETYANADPRKEKITLEQLLNMRSGLACDDYDAKSPGNESTLYESPDWVKATLDLPMLRDPGVQSHYCSGGVAVVGRLTERATGRNLPDFAQEALFAPLGISRTDWRWNYQLTNANREYSQIHLRPRDLLKFGLLYANDGQWAGQQVVPAAWVRASLSPQTEIGRTGYGYFWWQPWLNVETAGGTRRVAFSAAQGNGGQKIYIVPQYELVVVFTGGDYNSGGSPPNKIMATVILPPLIAAHERAAAAPR